MQKKFAIAHEIQHHLHKDQLRYVALTSLIDKATLHTIRNVMQK